MGINIEVRQEALAELEDELSNLEAGISDMSDRDANNCDHQGAKRKFAVADALIAKLEKGHRYMPEEYFAHRLQEAKEVIAHGLENLEGFDPDV